jgi:fibronectin-binding autotransporter adhesin
MKRIFRVMSIAGGMILFFIIFSLPVDLMAAIKTATTTGNWATGGTWGGTAPAATDTCVIPVGINVTVAANATCGAVTVLGTLTSNVAATLTVSGGGTTPATYGTVGGSGNITTGTTNGTRGIINFTGNWAFTGTFTNTRLQVSPVGTGDQSMGAAANLTCRIFIVNKVSGKFFPNTRLITVSTTFTLTAGTLVVDATTWGGNYSFATPTPAAGFTVEYTNANPTMLGGRTWRNLVFSGSGTAGASNTMTIQGNLTITGGGTLNFGANAVTISGTVTQNIAGFTTTGTVSMTKTGGIATLTGNVNGGALTINGNGGTLNLGAGLTHTYTGVWTRSAGTLNGGSSTLKIGGNVTNIGGTFTASTSTVNYTGAAQTIAAVIYYNLTLSGSAAKTIGASTVNNVLSMEGTATASAAPTYGAASTLQYNTATARTAGIEWITPFVGTGGVIIANTGTITLNAAKTFNLSVPLTINSGASLNTSVANNWAITFGGNFINNGGTIAANASAITITNTMATQSIAGFNTTGSVTCSKSAGVATLTSNINGGSLINSTAGGTLNLGAGLTHTITGAWTRTNGVLDGNSSTLNIGGTVTNTAGSFTPGTSTVNYNGAAQTIATVSYYNLTLSGSAIKTMPGIATAIGGDFTMSGTATATAAQAITITGSFILSTASNAFNAGSFSHTIGTNWTNAGTFTGNTSTVSLSGTNASISGTGTYNINNLIITGSGVTAAANTNLSLAGNFSMSGSGSFNHISTSTGTVTMSGVGTTITNSGSGSYSFNNFSVTGTVSTTLSLAIAGNFAASGTGSFSATAGTLTFSGSSKTITNSGSGALQFSAVTVSGSISATAGFSVSSNLSVVGSLTASAGTVTFNGTSILSGTANLFNVTLNGTSLQLGTNAVLGVGGSLALTAGTFNVTTTSPNTVSFNGTGAQNIPGVTYHHLQTATSGTKSAAGTLTVNGDLTIGSGSAFAAVSYTHAIYGNWTNSGTFTANSSTIEFKGSTDAILSGATTFNLMTVNKSASTNSLTLNNNINISTLNMTSGELHTDVNSVTITSTRTGSGIILGTIIRTHTFSAGIGYEFESPYNTIIFSSVGTVSSVTVKVVLTAPSDFPFGGSTNREYTNSVTGSGYSATLRLHYLDAGLNGNNEATMSLWRYNGSIWASQGKSANDIANNWVELSGITDITNRWCLSDDQNVVRWNGSASSTWGTAGNWTVVQGTPSTPPGVNDVVSLGGAAFTNQPTITTAVSVKSLQFGSAQAITLTLSGGSLTTGGNIDGVWSANANHTIAVGTQTLNVGADLILSDGTANHTIGLAISTGTVTVTGSLTERGGANITFSGAGNLNIATDYNYTSGTFTANNSTVKYNGTSSQVVAGLTYNNMTIDKTAGTASTSSAVTVGGALTLSTSANLSLGASLGVTGNITINAGTTLQANGSAITLGGNWINTGSFTAGTSLVTMNGIGSQTIGITTFNNLTINKSSGTASLTGNVTISGNLSVSNGTLDIVNFTSNRNPVGGTFSLSSGTTLRLSGPNNFPTNYSSYSVSNASTVEYYGAGTQTVNPQTYGNLTFSNGGVNAKSLSGLTVCAGNLLINSGSTFGGGTVSLDVQGNWTNSGSFDAGTGTVTFSGSSKSLTGTTTYNNLTVTGSYTSTGDISVNALMNISGGTYSAGSTTTTFSGNFTNTGTFTSSGTVNFSGTSPQTITLNSGFTTTGTTNFNGTVSPSFNSTTSPNFSILNINNSGGISPSRAWNISGAFTVANGASFNGGSATHTFSGPFVNNGTVTSINGILRFIPASSVSIALLGTAFSSNGSGIVEFGGSGFITVSGSPTTLTNVLISNTNVSGVTPATAWAVGGDLTINNGSVFNSGSGLNHTITGDIQNSGTLDGGTTTITMNGIGSTITGSGSTTFNNLIIAGSITANDDYNFRGNFTDNGTYLEAGGVTATSTGSSGSMIGGTTTPITFQNLVVNKSSAMTTLSANLSGLKNITIQSGTLDLGTYTITEVAGLGTIQVNSNATMRIGGTNSLPTFTSFNFDPTSTVEYYGGAQTITPISGYGNLLLSGSSTKTINASLSIDGNLTISNSTVLSISGAYTLAVGGNWQCDGLLTAGSSIVQLTGASNSIFGNTTFNDLDISGSYTNNGTITIGNSLSGSGDLTQGTNSNLTINGSPVSLASFDASASANTVVYAGTSAQSILTTTYYDLALSNSGIKTASSNFVINRDLTINLGSNLTIDSGVIIQVLGKVATAGLLNNNGELKISD